MNSTAGAADFKRGQQHMGDRDWRAAEAVFRKAIEQEPDNPAYHEQLGQSLFRLRAVGLVAVGGVSCLLALIFFRWARVTCACRCSEGSLFAQEATQTV
jgi:hypothetical protein